MPPLMFTYAEVEALVAGARTMIGSQGKARAAEAGFRTGPPPPLAKIAAALPSTAPHRAGMRTRLYAP